MSSTLLRSLDPKISTSTLTPYTGEKRTASGTPILPPVETLRPSPQQMRNFSSTGPVPTPSKQLQPQSQHQPETWQPTQPQIEAQIQAEHKFNEQVFASNAAHTASGAKGEVEGVEGEIKKTTLNGGSKSDLPKELGLGAGEVRDAGNASLPEVRDVAMQDV